MTIYSAIWGNGPLHFHYGYSKYTRESNKEVVLKFLHNLQNPVDSLINEAKKYSTKNDMFLVLYGISQNPDTSDYILVQNNSVDLVNWMIGNEKIDDFIQERQLNIDYYYDAVLELALYDHQFHEFYKTGSETVYSAIWGNGPLHFYYNCNNCKSDSNKEVVLKILHNLQNPIDSLINEAKKYSTINDELLVLYGISQNPDTNNYILVLALISEIDDFIQGRQLNIDSYNDVVFEWIPYNQFNEIKETDKNGSITSYSATWRYSPSCLKYLLSSYYTRDSNKEGVLKFLHNLQNPVVSLINETENCSTKNDKFLVFHGISDCDYIIVQNNSVNLVNSMIGNEKIDDFIQERQLNIDYYDYNWVFYWIQFNQFSEIKEISKNSSITLYSAIWNYARDSNEEVVLKCFHNLQNPVDSLINEAKKYSTKNDKFLVFHGISQNPDTNDYILVLAWTSRNEKIDNFIQERQLNINSYNDLVFKWIPYNQFNEIEETGKNGSITVYSAIWRNGPLYYKDDDEHDKCTRDPNKEVTLKYLHNLQNPVDSLINEAKKYSTINGLYGISQNPDTSDYILVQNNHTWASGNEKIDNFIQERQLSINFYVVFEWIPYNQFNEIEETGKNGSITVYSAIWRNSPLYYKDYNEYDKYTRDPNIEVTLKCLHNFQNPVDSLINEAKKYSTINGLYGISQNPDTSDYILVQNNTCASGNEKIDNFIQERQLNIDFYVVFEWIPYNQFNEIEETSKNGSITVYSAIWRNGPLHCIKYTRDSNKTVALKCLHNLQNPVDFLINEVKKYSKKTSKFPVLYGISQNPDTNDYILVLAWTSGNDKIDNFIQERQFNINSYYNDLVFEWIPYNQFNKIKETGNNGSMITVYTAIWMNGPIYYNDHYEYDKYTRDSNKEVTLKCLHNFQNPVDSLIYETKKYSTINDKFLELYGISQNPDTSDYILVLTWTSGNEKIDKFIQERKLNINFYDVVFEWIPYNQFNEIKETGKDDSITVYSAIWRNGPLHCIKYTRDSNKAVALKCLHDLQNPVDSLINEVKKYSKKNDMYLVLYGISQNPNTSDYILVLTRTSGNEKIDNFIQERQLNINSYDNKVFEWIPYNQFNKIEETGKNGSMITVYSAIWRNGPLYYNDDHEYGEYTRDSNKEVALKCFHNLQNPVDSLINEAKKCSTINDKFLVLYGISQNPDTSDYILVLTWTSGNKKIDNFIQERKLNINLYNDIVFEWIPYNQFNEIEETGKNGSITVYSAIWRNGPLYYNDDHEYDKYTRDSNKEIALKCLHNFKNPVDSLINEVKKYSTKNNKFLVLYGISQNPYTSDYILVENYLTWISENKKIDYLIQERQLNIDSYNNIIFEWIPYNQFNKIEKTGKNGFITAYSAIWSNGPLYYDDEYDKYYKYKRDSNKEVALKCLHNLQNPVDSLINEVNKYSKKNNKFLVLYGISQNPDTNDYILVEKYLTWISENKKIDDFVQERQLNIDYYGDIVFEWIPYNQFNEIEETGKNAFTTVYSAIWRNGVALKCLHDLQNPVNSLINEVKKYSKKNDKFLVLYGISQNPDTSDYILVQNNSINLVNWTIGNEKIDDFIQEMQLNINFYDDVVFEWISYNQFNEIKEIDKNGFITVYSAIWMNGPLHYNHSKYTRDSNKEVALKCLHNLQNPVDFLMNEAKKYSIKNNKYLVLYGISQNPDTSDYILV
ncbi:unnamed protein product [Rhizophagus irregularis]|nr:unnamed protein product [Rhizophagus irregularis]